MCGIAGILNLTESSPPDELVLRRMLASLRHRGPDEFGLYLDDHAGLGNARLSIIDLAGGQQPIATADERHWIVFNGEIFNYVELRRELEDRGHRFHTRSDTEVLLHWYVEKGPDGLAKLNGQFAFAIWDALESRLFLARDRLGVRPLYYAQRGDTLIFSSEIKALACHPAVQLAIDPMGLAQVFTYWAPLAPRTCFEGILELPPGHYLVAHRGNLEIHPYWQLSFASAASTPTSDRRPPTAVHGPPSSVLGHQSSDPAAPSPIAARPSTLNPQLSTNKQPSTDSQAYLEALRSLLIDAVRIRLRADVPVGAYLSGGLDSSLIAHIIREFGPSHLDTFSIAFEDAAFDESRFQRRMAQHLGTDHHVAVARYADIARVFPEVVWHAEAPLLRTAPAPMFLLSRLVRSQRYKVVLTGEGADEFFAGYDIFKEAQVRRFWARNPASRWRPLLLQRLYPDIARLSQAGPGFLAAFFREGLEDVEAPDYSHAPRWRTTRRTQRFFSEGMVERLRTAPASPLQYPADFTQWGPLERSQFLEVTTFLSPYLLASQGDRMAMAHSVEGRFPFLDYRVVEFCAQLPSRLKLRGLRDKRLLRELGREWLPPEITRRPKRPYRAPIHRCFFGSEAPEYVRELLAPEALRDAGLFRPDAVAQLIRKIEQGRPLGETDDMVVAGILSSQLLHRQFVGGFNAPEPLSAHDKVRVCRQSRILHRS